jgi:hypothetical protein
VRKVLRIVGALVLLGLLAAGISVFLGYRATQQVPEFYDRVLHAEPQVQEAAGDELEQQVLQLHNEVQESGDWEALFTDEQINGWLAFDLPQKFAGALPPGVSEPRVEVDPEQAQVACRYETGQFQSVVSLALEIQLTDEPNVLAIRICQARAGVLPLPLSRFLDQITDRAGSADIMVRWSQQDGDPVALVTVPTRLEQLPRREIHLETVELREGAVYLSGRTLPDALDQQAASPPSSTNTHIQR